MSALRAGPAAGWALPAVPLVVLLVLLGGCGGQGTDEGSGSPSAGTSASSPAEEPSAGDPSSAPDDPGGAPATSPTCAEVRAGIDAFNAGDFDGTVEHFEEAVPLAESAAAAAGSDDAAASELVEAVRYYADLPAADYPEASASSPLFAKYKAITLGQCQPVPTAPDSSGPTANA